MIAARLLLLLSLVALLSARAEEAQFYRAINLNGPELSIDGRTFEADAAAPNFAAKAQGFENQSVLLKPATDSARAKMLRSSRWGSDIHFEFKEVPAGDCQVFVYVWEDNNNERFNILVNDSLALENFQSGTAGMWKKLGPFAAQAKDGKLKISAKGGAANLSGLEIWTGKGNVPAAQGPEFAAAPTAGQVEFFEKRVRPLLVDACYECHKAGGKKIGGGLLLDSRAGIIKGGDSGAAIAPGDPDASLLIQAVRHSDATLTMPPKKKLPAEAIAVLEEWVKMGAPDPRTEDTVAALKASSAIDWDKARQWWSFKPVAAPKPPDVQAKAWPKTDLDRFVLAKVEAAGLKPAVDAEKRALLRRATFDLIGLPPTPEEVDAFVNDTSANAFAKVVDRLLESPRHGERWGRHWLDVVRYADTAGDNSDFPIPQMYRYRDWVIAAINRDLPYDQFIREQLAGDLLPAKSDQERHEKIIATGYIANARRFGSRVDDYPQHLTIEDTIDNVGRAFLGLSVSCARCHDHKFDPIPTTDYYGMYGVFQSTRYPWPGIELDQKQKDLVPLVSDEIAGAATKAHQEEKNRLDQEVKRLEGAVKESAGDEKKLREKELEAAKKAVDKHRSTPLPFEQAYAVLDAKKIEDATVQFKGDPAKPGERVRRRFLTALHGDKVAVDDKSSGRAQLADWLASKENPLTARVMANRIWLHHFGKGIVPTPNDFGKQGKAATNPELLDYLASRFVESGWSMKAMHRLIMNSRTYQLSSARSEEALAKDPANELLSSFPRRRLDAEAVRDTLLALGGNLDLAEAGPHPFPPQTEWKFTQHNPFKAVYETPKRTVYLMTQRIQRHPFMAIFDGPDPAASTAQRTSSSTPLQALFLLNDKLVHEQSKHFAERVLKEGADDAERSRRAYLLALARPATKAELASGSLFLTAVRAKLIEKQTALDQLDREAWQAYARVLFRLNEFVYVD